LLALLAASLAGNATSIVFRFGGHSLDTDGDGILDHNDHCPYRCNGNNSTCSEEGWLSGPATDFDGDGCQDGVEDFDKDGDGIKDIIDGCPFTAQSYKFVSSPVTDFDSDGCADGLEDTDDDGDLVVNMVDICPRTRVGALSDADGCSEEQRAQAASEQANGVEPGQARAEVVPPSNQPSHITAFASLSTFQEKGLVIRNAWVEVLAGLAMTELMHKVYELFRSSFKQRLWRSLVLRVLGYGLFFCVVYFARARTRLPTNDPQ